MIMHHDPYTIHRTRHTRPTALAGWLASSDLYVYSSQFSFSFSQPIFDIRTRSLLPRRRYCGVSALQAAVSPARVGRKGALTVLLLEQQLCFMIMIRVACCISVSSRLPLGIALTLMLMLTVMVYTHSTPSAHCTHSHPAPMPFRTPPLSHSATPARSGTPGSNEPNYMPRAAPRRALKSF
ncbi:hypothetical protein DENSPDRAFT_425775 [Dentipellis sp. KUC8613]|nr:hypothetical protein DENSPDRAFT_425775 [Dentipellis sp. KUC8613]